MSLRRSARTPVQRIRYASTDVATVTSNGRTQRRSSTKVTKKVQTNSRAKKPTNDPVPSSTKRKPNSNAVTSSSKAGAGTTTPATVKSINHSYSTGDIDDATPPAEKRKSAARPAQPHMTNALLRTPKGSRVSAATQTQGTRDAVQRAASADTGAETTTQDLLEVAEAHICKTDPRLRSVIDQHHCHIFSPDGLSEEVDSFRSLTSGIMAQQVSGAAAKSIKNKFIGLFNEGLEDAQVFPSPDQVAKTDIARLRLAGLSQRKAEYIQGLAEKFSTGELSAQMLANASDEEVLEKLVAVRGLGVWSVEMFMCFALKRMDILSTGDLGVQRGMAAYLGRDVAKLKAKGGKWKYISEKDMLDVSAKFAPYRSLFMWLMWRIEDVNIDALV